MKGMMELSEKVIYDDLTHHFKDKNFREKKYIYFDNTFSFFEKTKVGNIMLERTKRNQDEYKSDLN